MRTASLFFKVVLAEAVIVVLTAFTQPWFPPGDWRWLAIGIGSLAVLAIWVYVERRWERHRDETRKENLRLEAQVRQLYDTLRETETKLTRAQIADHEVRLETLESEADEG